MGKAKNSSSLLETMEETQNKVSNAESIRIGTLESNGTCQQSKEDMENGKGAKFDILK